MADHGDKFLVHWLDQSRAHRIVFMLELLGLDYDVEVYLRHHDTWRGPSELFQVHPSGKAPILEVFFADGRPSLKLAESGLIMQYLLKNYDPHNILNPTTEVDKLRVDYYLHYSEGTFQHILLTMLINSVAKSIAPIGFKSLAKMVTKGLNNGYYIHEWKLNMEFLERQLDNEHTGYFVGNKLTAADVMLTFPVYENIFDNENGIREVTGEKIDLFKTYPHLAAWSDRIAKHPIYIKVTDMMDDKVNEFISQSQQVGKKRH
ncbi:bifunctional glutathione transferase/peroxidase [Yamadazyma tenuis]|uniref:Glutathione S-transferase n=1 Tax=Candida tenuis (strain ATCC 10573 / BCRC 21748 / CBS 615 / JCM 9827 / NBRC 10315 / NRRL Y-1498 / VKM Y-70) TaxID=590646 RepID=G3BFA1_CANTC|nr:uncharacterized protein CANTEDRAFT_131897 [Yamadazyma tenuis ATCC 10573]EGV60006.1 hypothetical protein CANTEDRAFT_131897 [Yamadazyma tenuis ATCC 10573]WEJ94766.1 bifunctional glutathione transferase/peroxidase [Yamadazyma tenuis]